ncbi:MAG TPA: hypothetical protein VH680_15820 [Gemmatimonadales bacterium]|jgi:hypothetical protein
MTRGSAALFLLLALTSCRTYDDYPHVSDGGGLVPGDQLSRYGREQAQAVAVSRRFAELHQGESPEQLAAQADSAVAFARKQPDVVNASADPQGQRITLEFKSGWRVGVVPLGD